MIQKTRWTPDTCGCVVEYEWDDALPQEERLHNFGNVVKKCDAHSGLGSDATHFDHVHKENQTKNKVLVAMLEKIPRLKKQRIQTDGSIVEELDQAVEYKWSFTGKDDKRSLVVELKGTTLAKAEKDSLKAEVDKLDKAVTLV